MESLLIWFGSGFAFAVGVAAGATMMTLVSSKRGEDKYGEQILAYWKGTAEHNVEMLALIARQVDAVESIAGSQERRK